MKGLQSFFRIYYSLQLPYITSNTRLNEMDAQAHQIIGIYPVRVKYLPKACKAFPQNMLGVLPHNSAAKDVYFLVPEHVIKFATFPVHITCLATTFA